MAGWLTSFQPPLTFLLAGSDPVTIEDYKLRLIRKHLGPGAGIANRKEIDAAEVSGDELEDALRSLPLFAEKNAVVIRQPEKLAGFSRDAELIHSLFEAEDRLTILISTESASGLLKHEIPRECARRKRAAYFYAPRNEREAAQWVRQYCARLKVEITFRAAELLPTLVGFDTAELAPEIRKLAFAADGSISEETVEEQIGQYRENAPQEWTDAILARQSKAVALAEAAMGYGRGGQDSIYATIGLLNSKFNDIEALRSGGPLPPWKARSIERHLADWPQPELVRARELLLQLDLDLKSKPTETFLARIELATTRLIQIGGQI